MLVKCICSNCSHSYLADDQGGGLTCPRCGTDNEHARNPSDIEDAPVAHDADFGGGFDPRPYDSYVGEESFGMEPRFDPQAPPPMYVTGERVLKGMVFGVVATGALGFVLGGALAATQVTVPLVAAAVMALVAGATVRYGFGGRTTGRTMARAFVVLALVVVAGHAAFLAGSWAVERFTGTTDRDGNGVTDVQQTREDLDHELKRLVRERARTPDAGAALVLDRRITETERLRHLTDAELEDYLWMQKAQLGQPLLAYAKLRLTESPVVQVPKSKPVHLPDPAPLAIAIGELLIALALATRGIRPR